MTLTVLTDEQIRFLLENLTADDLRTFRDDLRAALHAYSTGTQKSTGWKSIHQPERTTIRNDAAGTNTLFMPSAGPAGLGVKVVTLSSAETQSNHKKENAPPIVKPTGAITLFSPLGAPIGLLHASTLTAFRTALASVCLVSKRDTVRTLTVFGCGEQAYWHVRLALLLRGDTIRHVNIIARRFNDGVKSLLKRFYSVPAATKGLEGWGECEFGVLSTGYGEYNRLLAEQVRAADIIFCCTPSTEALFPAGILTDHEGRGKGRLMVAIGSYTPEMHEIPVEVIQQAVRPHHGAKRGIFHSKHAAEGGVVIVDTLDALKEAGELIDAGLEPKQVVELGELVMLHNIAITEDEAAEPTDNISVTSEMLDKLELGSTTTSSSNTTGGSSGTSGDKLSVASAMSSVFGGSSSNKSSGSASNSRTSSPTRKSLKASIFHRRTHSHDVDGAKPDKDSDVYRLARWLQKGNVIYKSVGLGLMDLTVGMQLIKYAEEKGVGSRIEGF